MKIIEDRDVVMNALKYSVLGALITGAFTLQTAQAAAFELYELGTPIIGTAAVGQSTTLDASAAYFNPAAMSFSSKTQFMLGSQIMIPNIHFKNSTNNTISGNSDGNIGTLTPGMDMYLSYYFSPCLQFGVSVTSPYGGYLTYNDGWPGRYVVQRAFFYTINVNPSVAYRLNNWMSIGAGAAVEYMNLSQDTALPISNQNDGQIAIRTQNTSGGFNLGVMFQPTDTTHIGVAYRSQVVHNLSGDITFLRINNTPSTSIKMVMPQNVIASLSQGIGNNVTLLAELGWSNWASMKNSILNVRGFSAVTPRHWSDTYRAGLGAQFAANQALKLQAGVSYDSSPTTNSRRLPDLPMDKQIRAGVGLLYTPIPAVTLGLSYEYLDLGEAKINNTSSNGVLAGHYPQNNASTVQASLNIEV